MALPKRKTKIKAFKLPLDEGTLNSVINREGVTVIDKKVFAEKNADITVYVEYEEEQTAEGGQDFSW